MQRRTTRSESPLESSCTEAQKSQPSKMDIFGLADADMRRERRARNVLREKMGARVEQETPERQRVAIPQHATEALVRREGEARPGGGAKER